MMIPPDRLSERALRGVITEFVSREGTDYGPGDWSMDDKIEQVLAQIARGDVVILADPETGSCHLATAKDAARALEEMERARVDEDT